MLHSMGTVFSKRPPTGLASRRRRKMFSKDASPLHLPKGTLQTLKKGPLPSTATLGAMRVSSRREHNEGEGIM